MDDEPVVEDVVTKFLLCTCRPHPKITQPAVEAALHCVQLKARQRDDYDKKAHWIPLITGSVAEFYICLLYTSPSPRDGLLSRMPSSA